MNICLKLCFDKPIEAKLLKYSRKKAGALLRAKNILRYLLCLLTNYLYINNFEQGGMPPCSKGFTQIRYLIILSGQ